MRFDEDKLSLKPELLESDQSVNDDVRTIVELTKVA